MSEPFAQYPYGPYGTYPVPEPPRRHRGRHVLGLTATAVVAAAVGAGAAVALSHGTTPGATAASTSKEVLSTTQISSRTDPALVDVTSVLGDDGQGVEAKGTGIVLTANGEILTNNHVINGATSISVTDIGNGKTYTATVVGYDETQDIAVLQLSGASGLTTANIGDSNTVAVGDSVTALGNAGGVGGTPSVATGTVTALNQSITASDESSGTSEQLSGLIETNAPIQAGDSGGPLVNSHGQIIGIDTAASTNYEFGGTGGNGNNGFGDNGNGYGGYGNSGSGDSGSSDSGSSSTGSTTEGFTIPIDTAMSIARQIEAGDASSIIHIGATAFIGLEIDTQSTQSGGVLIEGTASGSPAAAAGITGDDLVTAINGQSVTTGTQISEALIGHHPGDKITVTWTNGETGQSQTATITLATGPAA
jgi:S1-C subfamily serine protease